MGLRDEILEQPDVAERLLRDGRDEMATVAAHVQEAGVAYVLIAARGSSDHAATYAQYALGAIARLPVALATPSLLTRYGRAPTIGRALVIGISQSGRSPDVVEVLAEGRRQGAVTVAMTNDPGSDLAGAAEHLVDLRAGDEVSIAATKTYGASLLAVAMLAAALGEVDAAAELDGVPAAIRQALDGEEAAEAAARAHRSMADAVVLGRGYNYATALEWALKLKEMAYVRAQGYSTADFQHGPAASLPPNGQVLAVSARGPMRDELAEVLSTLRGERSARVLLATEDQADAGIDGTVLRFPASLPEWLSPLAAIVPIQLFCYHLAREKQLDVESPRGLRKVTLTR